MSMAMALAMAGPTCTPLCPGMGQADWPDGPRAARCGRDLGGVI
jgi:hypothetical protein